MIDVNFCHKCNNWVDAEDRPCPICKALRERDEARRERDVALNEKDRLFQEIGQMERERDQALRERDSLADQLDQAIAERDGIAGERDQARRERDAVTEQYRRECLVHDADTLQLLLERDEARAVAREAVGNWSLLQELGHPPGCGPEAERLRRLHGVHPWLLCAEGEGR